MSRTFAIWLAVFAAFMSTCMLFAIKPVQGAQQKAQEASLYGKDATFLLPKNYREWVFLSSGLDMVYGPKASRDHSAFDNVFVDPDAYRYFQSKGAWPDKTVMVLEIRRAEANISINKSGQTQGAQVEGLEVHLKDSARFDGGWAFFGVGKDGVGKLIPQTASCYTCHRDHGAADTTFVQFYPTLLPVATEKGTLSAAYLKEASEASGSASGK